MAQLVVEGDRLAVGLSALERLGAFVLRRPEAPLAAVRSVRSAGRAYSELRGIRAPGTGLPGVIALGTWRYRGGPDFVAVYGRGPVFVVELEGARYRRFVVSSATAVEDAEALTLRLASTR